jgi:aminoglycoside phosphotransferase (APT) family kinase protein
MTVLELPTEARTALASLWTEPDMFFTLLPGGMTNRNWRVTRGAESCVVQVQLDEDAALRLGIDRNRQRRAHDYAAQAGIAPPVLLRRPDLRVQICSWQEGRELPGPGERGPGVVRELGATLRVLHDGPCDEGMFAADPDCFTGTHSLRAAARAIVPEGAAAFDFAIPLLARIQEVRGPFSPALTHNDLLPGNILCGPDGVRLIDFEYAAAGDPLYDLGDLAGKNDFGPEEIAVLVEAYGATEPLHAARAVSLLRFVSLLREGLWAVAAAGTSAEFDHLAYASALVERLRRLLDEPQFRSDLGTAPEVLPASEE